jgi:hypothetical protein
MDKEIDRGGVGDASAAFKTAQHIIVVVVLIKYAT